MTDPRTVIFGAFLGLCFVLVYASYHSKALAAGQPWASVEEYRRLPLACVGAPLYVHHFRQFLGFLTYKLPSYLQQTCRRAFLAWLDFL